MKKKLHKFFIKTAFELAKESKCVSHHVGALIVRDNRIISMGYNGTPPGLPNCCDVFDENDFDRKEHSEWSGDNEVHAEMNALMFAAKHNVEVEGCDIYVTISPCNDCLKNIIMSGIKNVYYLYEYDRVKINPIFKEVINIKEVSGASGIKKMIEKENLLYKNLNSK